jgi:SPP1 family predicted phage head-tail adaptor
MPVQVMEWPAFDPGRMVHKISIQKPTPGWDVSGPIITYETFLTTWAAIEPIRGTDVVRGGQITTQAYITITMPYQPGINASHRVSCLKGNFIIQSVENPLERDVLLVLNCVELGDKDTA